MTDLTGDTERVGKEELMASSMDSPSALPPSGWHSSSPVYDRSQVVSFVRAGLVALVLLGFLALIVLF